MKKTWVLFLLVIMLACDKQATNRNPYLQEVRFGFEINLNLPLYSPLTTIGNPVYIGNAQVGTRGAFVIKSGVDQYRVFEASCPNHAPNDCSTMSFSGQVATCSCEEFTYSLFTGQMFDRPDDGVRYYDMLEYRTNFSGNTVFISN